MENVSKRVETFVVLTTLDSIELANRITGCFEDLGIPVMLEYVEGLGLQGAQYKLSTQSQYVENASRVVENMLLSYDTKKIMTSKTVLDN